MCLPGSTVSTCRTDFQLHIHVIPEKNTMDRIVTVRGIGYQYVVVI